jgi:hypothetical protein
VRARPRRRCVTDRSPRGGPATVPVIRFGG